MAALKVIVGEEQSLEVHTPDQCAASDKNKEGVIRKKKTKAKAHAPEAGTVKELSQPMKNYMRYIQILLTLNKCHLCITQPQKRADIKAVLELVVCRIVGLRQVLLKSKSNAEGSKSRFPYSIDMFAGGALQRMRISPSDVELIFPEYIRDENSIRRRDFHSLGKESSSSVVPASDIITPTPAMDSDSSSLDKCEAGVEDDDLSIVHSFLDMSVKEKQILRRAEYAACKRRRQSQVENEQAYEADLINLESVLRDEESCGIRERLRDERMTWIAEQITLTDQVPDSLDAFYLKDESTGTLSAFEVDTIDDTGNGAAGRSTAKRLSQAESEAWQSSTLVQLNRLAGCTATFERRWRDKAGMSTRLGHQGHNTQLAKDLIEINVTHEITREVDESVNAYLGRIKDCRGGPGCNSTKIGTSEHKKKGGTKRATKTKQKKKEKPLPGDKLPKFVGMDSIEMVHILARHGMIANCTDIKARLDDLIGVTDAFGPARSEVESSSSCYEAPNLNQIKSAIIGACLPYASRKIKCAVSDNAERTILLYGQEGSGKTHIASAVVHHLGALLINLSPQLLQNRFVEKWEATELVHMVFTVAQDSSFGPVVILIDECEQFFHPKGSMTRFQKDLLIYKNQALASTDQAIIIGTTKNPDSADFKVFKWTGYGGKPEKQGFFELMIYIPPPNYVDRMMLWKNFAGLRGSGSLAKLDYGFLADESSGYSAGHIRNCFNDEMMALPSSGRIQEKHLLAQLKSQSTCSDEDSKRFMDFATKVVSSTVGTNSRPSSGKKPK